MRFTSSFLLFVVVTSAARSQEADELAKKPITTAPGKVGDLLRQWWKEGTAAGNVGDWYDNRDGGHSDLNTAPYPQLQRVVYSPEDIKAMRHWAAARVVRPAVTFGNSSTSAPPTVGGSNPRSYYLSPFGLGLLHEHYRKNNVYIYPEHRDHDPGHNGPNEGFGDLYPTNSPYLYISQGSSGSDQPWMRAIPYTLAAFRPDVKKRLVSSGLLMPTLQMLFRTTNKHLKDPNEYLTGKAHPTVFEGSWVDDLALVKAAHELTVDKIPPLVQLKVLEEETFEPGKDFFDPVKGEKLADTPCVIARIWRAAKGTRRMVVSAEDSFDDNSHPLKFSWVVLRGDPERIKIVPKNKESSVVELTVKYHERRPISPGSPLESNRVDIGVFVHNGHHYSAPAFVTWYSLDSEDRVYDKNGRIISIGYGMGEVVYNVTDWPKWIGTALEKPALLELTDAEQAQLREARPKIESLQADLTKARESQKLAEAERQRATEAAKKDASLVDARKKAEANVAAAVKDVQAKTRLLDDLLDGKSYPLALRSFVEQRCRKITRRNLSHAVDLFGFSKIEDDRFLANQAERLQSPILVKEFQGSLKADYRANFVDQRLVIPHLWRDIYRYDRNGAPLGWFRYDGVKSVEYSVHGYLIESKDERDRCKVGRLVDYVQEPNKQKGLNMNPLKIVPRDSVAILEYANDADTIGRVLRKEDRPREKK
jgi:hypothetical protein